uniref:J domain-containing protein n=1 Tax=Micromonas pusilla TaxID=38833 RepID=A0A7R9XX86_MICPS
MATLAELTASLTTLRIAYDPALVPPGGAEVVSACVSPVSGEGRMTAEPAGRKFHEKAMRAAGLLSADDIAAAAAKAEAKAAAKLRAERTPSTPLSNRGSVASFGAIENDDPESQENDASYKGPKELIRVGNREWPDLYDVIGLGRERYLATEKQIRDEYKRRSLWLHPDKCGVANASEEDKEKIEARFKNLQLALETLTDTKRRREYDSVDAPPTKLPSDLSPETFFDVAVPAFKSLAMFFDGKQDANKFIEADPDAPFERVRKMYEFWAKFKSWREFPANDEEDLEQAEDRYARREMERENKAKREKEKKLDTKKIKTFVERAEAADPRVIKKKLEEKEAREAKKHAKGAGRREAEEAAKKEAEAAAAAAAKAAEDDKLAKANAKKELEKQKKALRKEKARLREIASTAEGWVGHPGEEDVEELCGALSFDAIKTLCDAAEGADAGVVVEGLCKALAGIESAKSDARKQAAEEAAKRVAAEKASSDGGGAAKSEPWDDEDELKLLDKACNQKFPMGTKERWERVGEYLTEHGPRARTAKEVMVRYKAGL